MSPFGEVCGLAASGTVQLGLRNIVLAVVLSIDEGSNFLPMKLAETSPQSSPTWQGVSSLIYTAVLRSGHRVNANFTCVHTQNEEDTFYEDNAADAHTLEVFPLLTFHPHGWVRFKRSVLSLNRSDVLRYSLPLDIVEESMFRSTVAMADIERLYGKKLCDDQGESPSWIKNRQRSTRSIASIARLRIDSEQEERRLIETVLEPQWRERVTALAASLLRHPERTRVILRQWHAAPMFRNKLPHETYATFMETVLRSPVALCLKRNALHFFQDPALAIPVSWLTLDERIIVHDLVVHRKELFRHVSETPGQQYVCNEFRLDKLLSTVICRRFIVHQFVLDCVQRAACAGRERPELLLTIIEATGLCLVQNRRDEFLLHLKQAVECCNVLHDVAAMPLYIAIGDAVPAYAYKPPDRSQPQRQPCWTPK